MTAHTILLSQLNHDQRTRSYSDFETVAAAMDGVISLYEARLKDLNPSVRQLSYTIIDLNNYIDHLTDMAALVFDPKLKAYAPRDKTWIKEKVAIHLKKLANTHQQ